MTKTKAKAKAMAAGDRQRQVAPRQEVRGLMTRGVKAEAPREPEAPRAPERAIHVTMSEGFDRLMSDLVALDSARHGVDAGAVQIKLNIERKAPSRSPGEMRWVIFDGHARSGESTEGPTAALAEYVGKLRDDVAKEATETEAKAARLRSALS